MGKSSRLELFVLVVVTCVRVGDVFVSPGGIQLLQRGQKADALADLMHHDDSRQVILVACWSHKQTPA